MLIGRPDVYTSVSGEAMLRLKERSLIEDYFVYLHNGLILMVPEENPKVIKTVEDLRRETSGFRSPAKWRTSRNT